MRRLWITMMTAAVVATAGSAAMAQGPPPGGPHQQRIAAALGLTDEQKAVWDTASSTMQATAQPLHAQAKAIKVEIDALFAQGNPDPALLGQKMIAMHSVREQLHQARATMESTRTSVLTDEQKLKLDAIKAARPRHHGRPWGGPPPPSQ